MLKEGTSSDPKHIDQTTPQASEATHQDPKQKEKATVEVTMEDRTLTEEESEVEDMIIGDLDLDGLEAAVATNRSKDISPKQVNLLEKAIILSNKKLGVITGSPKEVEGKRKGKK